MKTIVLPAVLFFGVLFPLVTAAEEEGKDPQAAELAREVAEKGWIAYSAKTKNGTWDVLLSRPDGSNVCNLTNTSDFDEAAPRFSPDGKKMLYRRLKTGSQIDHDNWGFQGRLVIAGADGSDPTVMGKEKELPWASWSPDGKQVACLSLKGIEIVDLAAKKVVRKLPRKGFYQQLFWSPDGRWFCGTSNKLGESWTIARMDAETGQVNAVHSFQNCTPDWFGDSKHIVFSNRPKGQTINKGYGCTQLWMADGEGTRSWLMFGEDGYHIYGGQSSPDAKYFLFTAHPDDGGELKQGNARIYLMRYADAPAVCGKSPDLRKLHPGAKDSPRLPLALGWEPHWTYARIGDE